MRGGGVSGRGWWAAGGRLYLQIGLFGTDMSPVIGPDKPRGSKTCLNGAWENIRPIPPMLSLP